MILVSIRDEKLLRYEQVLCYPNEEVCKRDFVLALQEKRGLGSHMLAFPSDFTVYKIGDFDPTDGRVEADQKVLFILGELKDGGKESL